MFHDTVKRLKKKRCKIKAPALIKCNIGERRIKSVY